MKLLLIDHFGNSYRHISFYFHKAWKEKDAIFLLEVLRSALQGLTIYGRARFKGRVGWRRWYCGWVPPQRLYLYPQNK